MPSPFVELKSDIHAPQIKKGTVTVEAGIIGVIGLLMTALWWAANHWVRGIN